MHDLSEPIIIRPKIKEISYPLLKRKNRRITDHRTVKRRVEKTFLHRNSITVFPRSHVPFRFASQKNKSHARFHGSVFRISFASEVATNSWQRDSPRQEIDKRGVGRIGEDTRIRDCTATRYIRGYTLATTRPKCLIFPWLSANTNDRETNQFSRYDVVLRKFLEYEETFQGFVLLHQTLNSRGNVNVFLVSFDEIELEKWY